MEHILEAKIEIDRQLLPPFCPGKLLITDGPNNSPLSGQITIQSSSLKNGIRHFARVEGASSGAVVERLRELNNGAFLDFVSGSYFGIVDTPPCDLYAMLSETSCFLVDERATERYMIWRVVAKSRSAIRSLMRQMNKRGAGGRVRTIRKINAGHFLTQRQVKILRTAYENGFFETPRKVGVRELARSSGCSPSTFSVTLRKAQKKILAESVPAAY